VRLALEAAGIEFIDEMVAAVCPPSKTLIKTE
jgi:hypothetical protein